MGDHSRTTNKARSREPIAALSHTAKNGGATVMEFTNWLKGLPPFNPRLAHSMRSTKTTRTIVGIVGPICLAAQMLAFSETVESEKPPDFAGVIDTPKLKHIAGERKVLAILWDPHRAEHPAPPAEEIAQLLFGERPSVKDWFHENSRGKLVLEKAAVLGWYDADKPGGHYWNTNSKKDPDDKDGDGWLNGHTEKGKEAIRKADREFDFAKYDANHDRVLTDDELAILIVIPQRGPFGTNRPPAGREAPNPEQLVVDGVRIPMIAEWYTGNPPNLGAPAHELCHQILHTPDMYMTGPWPYAAGDYSLMDHSYTAAHLDPFEKLKLGGCHTN